MATPRWLGRALATTDVWTITVANTWAQNDTGTITINGKSLTLTVGSTFTTAQVAADLTVMFNASGTLGTAASANNYNSVTDEWLDQPGEFAEATAEQSSSTVIIACDTPGVPMTISVSESTAGSGTLSIAHTTTATGPNYWDNAVNWDTGAVPVSTDTVYFDNSDVSVLYGLAQSAVTLTALHISASYTGHIGLPKTNADGGYPEYRADYLAISATNVYIGRGEGNGSGRIKLDQGAVAGTFEIFTTGQGDETGLGAVLIKGSNITAVEVHSGSVGLAPHGADTATITTLRVASGSVHSYTGSTITTVNLTDGTLIMDLNCTTLNQNGGACTINGSTGMTTANVNSGTLFYNSSGTIATLNLSLMGGGALDCSGDISARTITTTNLYAGGTINDPQQTITYTNKIALATNVKRVQAT